MARTLWRCGIMQAVDKTQADIFSGCARNQMKVYETLNSKCNERKLLTPDSENLLRKGLLSLHQKYL